MRAGQVRVCDVARPGPHDKTSINRSPASARNLKATRTPLRRDTGDEVQGTVKGRQQSCFKRLSECGRPQVLLRDLQPRRYKLGVRFHKRTMQAYAALWLFACMRERKGRRSLPRQQPPCMFPAVEPPRMHAA